MALFLIGSIWYPINLLAGSLYAPSAMPSIEQMLHFHLGWFLFALALHLAISLLVGLLYGAMLPMLPNRPILLGGIIAPLIWTGLLYHVIGYVNPLWTSASTGAGLLRLSSRSGSLRTWWWRARTKCGRRKTCRSLCEQESKRPALCTNATMPVRMSGNEATVSLAAGHFSPGCLHSPVVPVCRGKPQPGPEVPRPDSVLDPVVLYSANCAGCHGADGKSGPAMMLSDPVYLAIVDDDTLRSTISKGRPGTAMSAFAQKEGGMLTDEQINSHRSRHPRAMG